MTKKRALILIDGSNFFFKIKSLGFTNLLNFDFRRFAELLVSSDNIGECRYYIGKIQEDGSKKSAKLLSDQQKLFERLKANGFTYVLGYLLKSNGVYHEKGVDVQIAVDMIVAAYEYQYDRIILVSSDTDLGPAIKKVQEKKKTVEYVEFANKPSKAMINYCKRYRLLNRDDIKSLIADIKK